MYSLPIVFIATAFALTISAAAVAQTTNSAVPTARSEHRAIDKDCASEGKAVREPCAKSAQAPHDAPQCGGLIDREKGECMLEDFVRKHDRAIGAGSPPR
jgi:hypothetical protein